MTTFIHTADWQLGKPFSRVADDDRRASLRKERFEAVKRIGEIAREHQAAFVLVAGDLFDSNCPPNSTVSDACDAIASIGVPVYAIPGNHDHGGPGSVWEQDFFRAESAERAPNFKLLLKETPELGEGYALLPCPLQRRQAASDPCRWLREYSFVDLGNRARIVIAHGSTLNFQGESDDEDVSGQPNFIQLEQLPTTEIDYVALGDWHGLVQAGEKAWYSGSHETDRFPKASQTTGHVAVVRATRGNTPSVTQVPTGSTRWLVHTEMFSSDAGPATFKQFLNQLTDGVNRNQTLLKMTLGGSLGLAAHAELENILRSWQAALIDLRLDRDVAIAPTREEIEALVAGGHDPLITHAARELQQQIEAGGDDAAIAGTAIGLLYEFSRTGASR